jgi:bacterioferritin
MHSEPEVIDLLNEVLTSELTAINQYFIHYKMCQNQGYKALAHKKRSESIEEMKHAELVIDRILFLDGVPNMQRLSPVRVGEEPLEMNRLDLELELDAVSRLHRGIALMLSKNDHGTRDLLERILKEEEDSVDWLETQASVVKDIGREHYLAQNLKSSS